MIDTLRAIAAATTTDTSAQARINRVGLLYTVGQSQPTLTALRQLDSATAVGPTQWLGYHGLVAALEGNRVAAAEFADSLRRERGPYLLGWNQFWRARILARIGRADDAIEAFGGGDATGLGWVVRRQRRAPRGAGLHFPPGAPRVQKVDYSPRLSRVGPTGRCKWGPTVLRTSAPGASSFAAPGVALAKAAVVTETTMAPAKRPPSRPEHLGRLLARAMGFGDSSGGPTGPPPTPRE